MESLLLEDGLGGIIVANGTGNSTASSSVAGGGDEEASWAAIVLVGVPAAYVCGFAAAAMSFTAWNIVVPLFFTAFGLPVFQSLFISVMMDVANGGVLTFLYGLHGKVDFKFGFISGCLTSGIAITMAIVLADFIEENEDKLKSAVAFVPLLIGIIYFIKGVMAFYKQRKRLRENEALQKSRIHGGSIIDRSLAFVKSDITEDDLRNESEDLEHSRLISTKSGNADADDSAGPGEANAMNGTPASGGQKTYNTSNMNLNSSSINEETDRTGLSKYFNREAFDTWTLYFAIKFKADEDLLRKQLTNRNLRIGVTVASMAFLGVISGTLYAGGGMFFAIIMTGAWNAKIRTAAGTGCLIMTMVMACIAFTFIGRSGMDDMDNFYHLLIMIPPGLLGAITGAKLALKLSEMVMYFVIVGVCLALFIFIAVQGIFSDIQDGSGLSLGP